MTIYQLCGYDFDPVEWCKTGVAAVFKTREEAEAQLALYMEEARSILNSCFNGDHTQYVENLRSRNGHPRDYTASIICDMADKGQREVYIDTISGGFLSEEHINWPKAIDSHTKTLPIVQLTIKELTI